MKLVIDISQYQNPANIDYVALASVIDGAIIRVNYGRKIDPHFHTHYQRLSDLGKPLGFYSFPLDTNLNEQEDIVMEAISGKFFAKSSWVDVEITPTGSVPQSKHTVDRWFEIMDKNIKVQSGVYTNHESWRVIMRNSPDYTDRLLWVANYTTKKVPLLPVPWKKWVLWQYTNVGRVAGYYNRNIDLNRYQSVKAWDAIPAIGIEAEPVPEEPAAPSEKKPLYKAKVLAPAGLIVRASVSLQSQWVASALLGDIVNVWEEAGDRVRIDTGWISKVWGGKPTIERLPVQEIYLPIVVKPQEPPEITKPVMGPVEPLSQHDARWNPYPRLGTSSYTISRYGCLFMCMYMDAKRRGLTDNISQFMTRLIAHNGFVRYDAGGNVHYDNASLFRFASAWEAYPTLFKYGFFKRSYDGRPDLMEIDKWLDKGVGVTVAVRNMAHWVHLVRGNYYEGYLMVDPIRYPAQQAVLPYSIVYGDPARTIYTSTAYDF